MSRATARRHHPNPTPVRQSHRIGLLLASAFAVLTVASATQTAGAVPSQKSSSSTQASVSTTRSQKSSSSTHAPTTYASTQATYATTVPTTAPTTIAPSTEPPTTEQPSTTPTFADAGGVQPFPAPLVGPVPAAEAPVERLMTNVYVTASTDSQRPQVVVQFKSPFTLPTRPYRVSVLLGDPAGAQLRSSLIGNGAGVVSWKAEKAPAPPAGSNSSTPPAWTTVDSNDTDASFSASGLVAITVPLKDAPDGPAVWAEIESGSDGKQVSVSPYFSRPAMFNEVSPGQLPSSIVGAVMNSDGTPSGQNVTLPAGPVLSLSDKAIQLQSADRPPTQLAGQKVEKAYDFVRIAPSFNKRAVVTDYVFIDRSSGEVKLLDGFTVPPSDRTGRSEWVRTGLPQGDPGAPGQLQFDLQGISRALGIQMSTNATGFGLRREYVLADGRRVVAEAVLGTVSWLGADQIAGIDQAAAPEPPPVGPLVEADQTDTATKILTIGGIAVGVLLVVLAAVIIVVRRRRRRARGDAADLLDAIAVETQQHRAVLREERRATGQVPIVVIDPEPAASPEPTPVEGLAALVNTGPAEPVDGSKRRRKAKASTTGATDADTDPGKRSRRRRSEPSPSPSPATAGASEPVAVEPARSVAPAVGTEALASGSSALRPGGAKRTIDADPVWADDAPTSGERPIISARSVRPAKQGDVLPTQRSTRAEPKLRSTIGKPPGAPAAEGSPPSGSSPLQPVASRERSPEPVPPSRPPAAAKPAKGGKGDATRVAPSAALESLGAEFDELSKRLERLEPAPTDIESNA